jgi:hypothetical protein
MDVAKVDTHKASHSKEVGRSKSEQCGAPPHHLNCRRQAQQNAQAPQHNPNLVLRLRTTGFQKINTDSSRMACRMQSRLIPQ